MKKRVNKFFIGCVFLFLGIISANAQQNSGVPAEEWDGIGPVISISETYASLPEDIKTFINTHFKGVSVVEIQLKTIQGVYKINMENGYELKFLAAGEWIEVEAPHGKVIPSSMLKTLLPHKSYATLEKDNMLNSVEQVNYLPTRGYEVGIKKIQDYFFDVNGNSVPVPIKNIKKADCQNKESKK